MQHIKLGMTIYAQRVVNNFNHNLLYYFFMLKDSKTPETKQSSNAGEGHHGAHSDHPLRDTITNTQQGDTKATESKSSANDMLSNDLRKVQLETLFGEDADPKSIFDELDLDDNGCVSMLIVILQ